MRRDTAILVLSLSISDPFRQVALAGLCSLLFGWSCLILSDLGRLRQKFVCCTFEHKESIAWDPERCLKATKHQVRIDQHFKQKTANIKHQFKVIETQSKSIFGTGVDFMTPNKLYRLLFFFSVFWCQLADRGCYFEPFWVANGVPKSCVHM